MNLLELIVESIIYPGLMFIALLALLIEGIERKFVARLQSRMGPAYTGLRGFLQPFFDVIKLLGKEDLPPRGQDPIVPALLIASLSLAVFAALYVPWSGVTELDFQGDAILVPASLVLSTGLLYMASYSTHSPFNIVGGLRLLGLLASYEVAFVSLLAIPYAITGSLEIAEIRLQLWSSLASKPMLIPVWLAGLVLGFLLLLFESGKGPFDIAEAKTEVAGGIVADFSGRRLAFAHLTHRVQFATAIFYYASLFIAPPLSGFPGFLLLLVSGIIIAILIALISAASPRIRLVDIGRFSWGILVPVSLILATIALII